MRNPFRHRIAWPIVGLAVLVAPVALAQSTEVEGEGPRLRPDGLRLVGGMVLPENADDTFGYGFGLDLGTVAREWLHLCTGVTRWSADIDRSALDSTADGTVDDLRLHVGLGVEPLDLGGVRPYVGVGLALHVIGADIPDDSSTEDALAGTNVGAEFAFGATSTAGSLRLSAEARREFVSDVENWSFFLGVGRRWGERD